MRVPTTFLILFFVSSTIIKIFLIYKRIIEYKYLEIIWYKDLHFQKSKISFNVTWWSRQKWSRFLCIWVSFQWFPLCHLAFQNTLFIYVSFLTYAPNFTSDYFSHCLHNSNCNLMCFYSIPILSSYMCISHNLWHLRPTLWVCLLQLLSSDWKHFVQDMTKFRILRLREMGSTWGTFQNRNPAGADITHYCHLVAMIVDSRGTLCTDPRRYYNNA